MDNCVFCKIVRGEIPTEFVYQDENIAVFADINPAAPVHLLFIPKNHIEEISDLPDEILIKIKDKMLGVVEKLDLKDKGYRFVANGGKAKAVAHLHFHLLGDVSVARKLNGP